jgi:hypothetical protein
MLALLWHGLWVTDLTVPLSPGSTRLSRGGYAGGAVMPDNSTYSREANARSQPLEQP